MNAIKTVYNSLPENISIPKEFIHRKAEIIIILEDDINDNQSSTLASFYGCLPDFPARFEQGNFEKRELL